MTQEQIEYILDSDLPNNKKSELIKGLYDIEHLNVSVLKKGGKTKLSFEEWIKTVPEDRLSDNYDLKTAYENYPEEMLEDWKNSSMEDLIAGKNHLGSVVELPNGNYMFLKLGKEDENPELLLELESYRNGSNELSKTHDLIFNDTDNRYYYIKKQNLLFKQEGGVVKLLHPEEEIEIGDQEYDVEIADTAETRKDGLSRVQSLKKDEGMLFIFDTPSTDYFTMKDTSLDLDIIFIDEEGIVLEVHSSKAYNPDPIYCKLPYLYVLEVNINSGIESGDELSQEDYDFDDDDKEKIKHSKMLVLNSDGDVQMKLIGGERIISMIKTRLLIKAALKAYKSDEDKDYRRVGKLILKELDAQDNRDPQYIEK